MNLLVIRIALVLIAAACLTGAALLFRVISRRGDSGEGLLAGVLLGGTTLFGVAAALPWQT